MKNQDNELRIIAIADKEGILANLFGGLTVNKKGSIRIGKIDIHPNEMGPALARAVQILNDYVEGQENRSLPPNRAMFLTFSPEPLQRKQSDKEQLTSWLYASPETLDVRTELLEKIVTQMRQSPKLVK